MRPAPRGAGSALFRRLAARAGAVLVAWLVALTIEHVVVGFVWRDFFSGAWELGPARTAAAPLWLAVAAVPAFVVAMLFELCRAGARRALGVVGGAFGLAVGVAVTHGRHFESPAARVPFVLVLAALAGAGMSFAPRVIARADAAPRRAAGAFAVAALGLTLVDATVLPRLYAGFHEGTFALALVAAGFAGALVEDDLGRARFVVLAVAALSIPYAPTAAQRLRGYDNLRRILVEHAPWIGRSIRIAAVLAPPPRLTVEGGGTVTPAEVKRTLDWSGRDLVLLSVDALRADHVGAYGYERKTTPAIDALAAEGTLFEDAYCPTPHTSYSVTSMMTGKYMRPLLTLGLGDDSETWAGHLRRYDYRTAAFYPPAVFFIDPERFVPFRDKGLDFEYRKEEFADPALRERQVRDYLATAPKDRPLFLWVHFFEPHEPYVAHPEHPFGDPKNPRDVDRYDSEIASADEGIGAIVRAVREVRPGAIFVVTADHGEELGDHGGRYHGTTVYEEQVRVPLVVVGPGVTHQRVATPVQTIDLLPTVLSAVGIPRPARIRGRDLGPLLGGTDPPGDHGLAFAETDDYELLADGPLRFVCDKRIAACSLYDVTTDRAEKKDLGAARPDDVERLRVRLAAVGHDHGRFEGVSATQWPEALRRGMQGDVAAAPEVAALLDDVDPSIRRRAAGALFDLRSKDVNSQLARATTTEHDDETLRWELLALARGGGALDPRVTAMAGGADLAWARPAALVLVERGDATRADVLATWLASKQAGFARDREIVTALGAAKAVAAVPVLVAALSDLRLRPFVADALAAIGDKRAVPDLLERFQSERYVGVRTHEARALAALGAGKEMAATLARFAGLPEPMEDAVAIAASAGLLEAARGGTVAATPGPLLATKVKVAPGPARLLVRFAARSAAEVQLEGRTFTVPAPTSDEVSLDLGDLRGGELDVRVAAAGTGKVGAFWIVPAAEELPPPPKEGDAGAP
jgi:arylsulfatase A-like enzyme/HEAT repeat protein